MRSRLLSYLTIGVIATLVMAVALAIASHGRVIRMGLTTPVGRFSLHSDSGGVLATARPERDLKKRTRWKPHFRVYRATDYYDHQQFDPIIDFYKAVDAWDRSIAGVAYLGRGSLRGPIERMIGLRHSVLTFDLLLPSLILLFLLIHYRLQRRKAAEYRRFKRLRSDVVELSMPLQPTDQPSTSRN